jgi:putative DNA primase/helicase
MLDRSVPTDQPSPAATRRARAALGYAELGWPVLPLHTPAPGGDCSCGSDCPKPGKHPRSRRGLRDATTRAEQVATWWAAWPDANIGVATGQLLVVDVDGGDGRATLAELEAAHALLPATLTATTGRGLHLYFAANDHRIGNSPDGSAPASTYEAAAATSAAAPQDPMDGGVRSPDLDGDRARAPAGALA